MISALNESANACRWVCGARCKRGCRPRNVFKQSPSLWQPAAICPCSVPLSFLHSLYLAVLAAEFLYLPRRSALCTSFLCVNGNFQTCDANLKLFNYEGSVHQNDFFSINITFSKYLRVVILYLQTLLITFQYRIDKIPICTPTLLT